LRAEIRIEKRRMGRKIDAAVEQAAGQFDGDLVVARDQLLADSNAAQWDSAMRGGFSGISAR